MRFGAAAAKLTTAAPKLGLPAEYGLSWILPRLVGVSAAADLLISGRTFTAAEAPPGLFNAVYDTREALLEAVTDYARGIATRVGPNAVTQTKQQLYRDILSFDVGESIEDSKRRINDAMNTDEYREASQRSRSVGHPASPMSRRLQRPHGESRSAVSRDSIRSKARTIWSEATVIAGAPAKSANASRRRRFAAVSVPRSGSDASGNAPAVGSGRQRASIGRVQRPTDSEA
jgi:hypothetical protein